MSDLTYRSPREPLVVAGRIESHVADMTVTVAADVTLKIVQEHLAKVNQWIPIDGDSAWVWGLARFAVGVSIQNIGRATDNRGWTDDEERRRV
jgi:FAD/FMN-containing dehydrogenase